MRRVSASLTEVAEEDREEDETVGRAEDDYAEIHAEVEDLEELGGGEREN